MREATRQCRGGVRRRREKFGYTCGIGRMGLGYGGTIRAADANQTALHFLSLLLCVGWGFGGVVGTGRQGGLVILLALGFLQRICCGQQCHQDIWSSGKRLQRAPMDDLNFLPASEMAARIRRKEISIVELAEAHLSRIDRVNPRINAIVSLDPERIRREARSAETAVLRGEPLGPLHGVPITIKSSIDVQGLPCQTGSKLRAGNIPEADAPLVRRLKAAGAIVLGNTNVPELLMAYETDNLLDGRTNNPWDLECTPGGSSGGEAAAIAAGCSAGGVGSDGGGSIRVPAHFCGIAGLKPTPGRIPGTGHFPVIGHPSGLLTVAGPMARTARDLQLLFIILAGYEPRDPFSTPLALRRPQPRSLR